MISDLLGIVNKFIPDGNKAKALEAKIQEAHNNALNVAVKADKEIRLAELRSGGLASMWRPLTAIMTYSIIFFHWLIYPMVKVIIGLCDLNVYYPELKPLPVEFYGLATAFISIYAYGRSMEKRRL